MPVDSITSVSASASAYAGYWMTTGNAAAAPIASGGYAMPVDIVEIGSSASMSMSLTYTAGAAQSAPAQDPATDQQMLELLIAMIMLAMMSGDEEAMSGLMDMLSQTVTGGGQQQSASMESLSMSFSMSNSSYMAAGSETGATLDLTA
jgi:flagellar biosynthesis protein FliR